MTACLTVMSMFVYSAVSFKGRGCEKDGRQCLGAPREVVQRLRVCGETRQVLLWHPQWCVQFTSYAWGTLYFYGC